MKFRPTLGSRAARPLCLAFALASLAVLAAAPSAYATFHIARIEDVLAGNNGTTDLQYVEVRMLADGQNLVSGSKLTAFDATGAFSRVILTVPSNVQPGVDRRWIMGSQDYQAVLGVAPDFVFTSTGGQGLFPTDGMVCWGKPADQTNPEGYVDCVSYGNYTGPPNSRTTAPTPISPFGHSIVRSGTDTNSSAADFVCSNPISPENNNNVSAPLTTSVPCPVCGNATAEVGEQCDGADDALCPGFCQSDCTCSNDCGNDAIELGEQCDGSDDAACPGLCQVNCTCGSGSAVDRDGYRCVTRTVKASSKLVAAYGKAVGACVKAISRGNASDDVLTCVTNDAKGKLAKFAGKVSRGIEACTYPYAIDCPAPCDATDAGGLSAAVDDATELADCLACINPATSISRVGGEGADAALIADATIAQTATDRDGAKCQGKVLKAFDKLVAGTLLDLTKCAASELSSATPPVGSACIGVDTTGKVGKALTKLEATVARCNGAVPFDANACAGLSDAALTSCAQQVAACAACRWGNVLLGSSVDCDQADNGTADASCPLSSGGM